MWLFTLWLLRATASQNRLLQKLHRRMHFLGVAVPVRFPREIVAALAAELPLPGVHLVLVLSTDIAAGGCAMLVAIVEVELSAGLEGLVTHTAEVAVPLLHHRLQLRLGQLQHLGPLVHLSHQLLLKGNVCEFKPKYTRHLTCMAASSIQLFSSSTQKLSSTGIWTDRID